MADPKLEKEILEILIKCIDAKDLHQALGIITNEACAIVGGKGGSIWLRSPDNPNRVVLSWGYRHGAEKDVHKIGEANYTSEPDAKGFYDGLTGWVFATGEPLLLRDITNKKEIQTHPNLKWRDKYRGFKGSSKKSQQKSFMAVPIFSTRSRSRVIGVLRVSATRNGKKFFTYDDLKLLRLFSGHIGGLLTNHLKRQEEEHLLINLFTNPNPCDIQPILEEITKGIPIVLDGSYCSIFLLDNGSTYCLEATNAPSLFNHIRAKAHDKCLQYKRGEGKTGTVALTGEPICVAGDIKSRTKLPNACETNESAAFLAVPIKEGDMVIGIIRVVRAIGHGQAFDDWDTQFLLRCANRLISILSYCGLVGRGNCFVIMPFSESMKRILANVIRPCVEALNFVCKTEADYQAPGHLTPSIISHIANANLIIAEVTDRNPNVFYELGIAHALDQTVILLTQNEVPSDVRHWRYYTYKDEMSGEEDLKKKLTQAINEGIREGTFKVRY